MKSLLIVIGMFSFIASEFYSLWEDIQNDNSEWKE